MRIKLYQAVVMGASDLKILSISGASRAFAIVAISIGADAASAQSSTANVVSSANAFLATLDAKQKQSVTFAYDDAAQRVRWSNFPTGFVRRAGINLREMSEPQRMAVMSLMSTVLSKRGYEKVQQIMATSRLQDRREFSRQL